MKTSTKQKPQIEYCLYAPVVSMTAQSAIEFWGSQDGEPVDLGPAAPERYKPGARVWGFLTRPETSEEKAHRLWTVANGGTVT